MALTSATGACSFMIRMPRLNSFFESLPSPLTSHSLNNAETLSLFISIALVHEVCALSSFVCRSSHFLIDEPNETITCSTIATTLKKKENSMNFASHGRVTVGGSFDVREMKSVMTTRTVNMPKATRAGVAIGSM